MSSSLKNKITEALQKAKQEGGLRTDKIREIVQSAVSETISETKEGSFELRTIAQEAVSSVMEVIQERGGEIKEDISASVEGAIRGISSLKRQSIAKSQAEIKDLQAKIESEEEELRQQIDGALVKIEETGQDQSASIKAALESAIHTIKDSEEMALMQKRYAQLKAQLAILQANLSERYGEQYEEVKKHLDEAQSWYERAKTDPEVFTDKIKQRHQDFEDKLGEAGTALAKKEKQGKQLLQELWKSATELFRDKQ